MKYLIYAAIAALVVWSVVYVVRHVRAQMRGDCGCGKGSSCSGNCSGCSGCASGKGSR